MGSNEDVRDGARNGTGAGDGVAVAVRGLTKRFGRDLAVDGLSFDVPFGRVVGFLGPNGSGKSTTLRMTIGLTRATAGSATILGVPFRALADPARTVGSIVDGVGFHPGRRALDELRLSAATAGIEAARCEEVLELVGLADAAAKRVGAYSLGMRQRLGIARALLGDPRILLLDEPANGLDPQGIHWIRTLLRQLADEGRAVLVSSHLLGEVARFADEVVVIRGGRFVAQSPVAELLGGGGVRVASGDDVALTQVLRTAGATVAVESDGPDAGLLVRGMSGEVVGETAFAAGIAVHELYERHGQLEDVFLELTSNGGTA